MAQRIVILLRAVNLGATNKVSMPRLRELVVEAGAADVETYIASGNLVCTPPAGGAAKFTRAVEKVIADEFGVTTTAVSRTAAALRTAREAYPFDVHDPKLCWISFLDASANAPTPAIRKAVAQADFGDDRARLIGRELHLSYVGGVHGSRMTVARLSKLVGADSTARNLRTVDKLLELVG